MIEMFQEWYDNRHEYAMGFQRGDMINLELKF
jgi:hypothetical protein